MPADFEETLDALDTERPLMAWASLALAMGLVAVWGWWLLTSALPQREIAREVMRDGGDLVAVFSPRTAPETALIRRPLGEQAVRVTEVSLTDSALTLRMAAGAEDQMPGAPLPDIALPLPPQSPAQMVARALGLMP